MIEMADAENADVQKPAVASVQEKVSKNPLVRLAGHVLLGAGFSTAAYLGGAFVQGVASAIGYLPLANIALGIVPATTSGLGIVVAGFTFAGYLGYELLYG